ncbi:MAG: outer membrane protein transport protein, partial [Myxococcales bacterium]|nr:outer membrane protein transport protein [Myxococcales bacterium]
DGVTLPAVTNQAPPYTVPQLGFASPLAEGKLGKLAFAFGMVSPYAPSADYDPTGPQRYTVVDTAIYQFSWGPSIAYQPHPMVTFGLGLQAKALILEQSLVVAANGEDNPAGDIGVRANVTDAFTPNINLGLLVEPHEAVSFGLAVQPATTFRAKGSAVLDLTTGGMGAAVEGDVDRFQDGRCEPDQVDPVCANQDGIGLEIKLPLVVRAGVAVRFVEDLEIELAAVWQNWATLTDILLTDVDPELIVFGSPAELESEFALPAGLRNTTSIRLGGEWRASDLLELRAGGFWENGAFPAQRMTVALYDPSKVQIGGGASLYPMKGRFRFDVSAAKLFFPKLTVTDSEIQLVNVDVLGFNRPPETIGNGTYSSKGWVAAAQLSILFGSLE